MPHLGGFLLIHSLQGTITQRIHEAIKLLQDRRIARESNVGPVRPAEEDLKKLDSSMKRNTALIRKLKQLSDDSCQAILGDIVRTNQSMYVSEAATAIAEAPFKLKDIPGVVSICSALHQRYAEFSQLLVSALTRTLMDDQAGLQTQVPRKRTILRLLVELLLVGVYQTHNTLLKIVKELTRVDFVRAPRETALTSVLLITAFVKAGKDEILGLGQPLIPELCAGSDDSDAREKTATQGDLDEDTVAQYKDEVSKKWTLPAEVQESFMQCVLALFDSACKALQMEHDRLTETELENEKILNTRGDLSASRTAAYEEQRASFETLQRHVASLAEVLERNLPELKSVSITRLSGAEDLPSKDSGPAPESSSPFEDEETRAFYESLPDLRELVPAVLLGTVSASSKPPSEPSTGVEDDLNDLNLSETPAEGEPQNDQNPPSNLDLEQSDKETGQKSFNSASLDPVMARLPNCVSKESCDSFAVDFCYAGGAHKGARRRLARGVVDPCTLSALQIIPHFARILAILNPLFPEILPTVIQYLEREFFQLIKKKDATTRTLEPRVKNARYVAELVKFRLFPAGTAFSMLKTLLDDFVGHNVDAACELIECAGRYLLRRPDTTTRMNNMLDVMMKLKNARNLDARHAGMVDSAFFAVKSVSQGPRRKERPPMHEWIRYLIYSKLDTSTVPFVLKKLRRLKWKEDGGYVVATLLRASRKGRASQQEAIAILASRLSRYHPFVGMSMVDGTIEEIMAGLEFPESSLFQHRVASVRLLGHLYVYKLANAALVFDMLHLILAYGHGEGCSPEESLRLDPPSNYFRIRLVCSLLETCSNTMTKGSARGRLDKFLPYLQRYVLFKPPLPLDIELDLQELYTRLKVVPIQYNSFEEACSAVSEIEKRVCASASNASLKTIAEEQDEDSLCGDSDTLGGSDNVDDYNDNDNDNDVDALSAAEQAAGDDDRSAEEDDTEDSTNESDSSSERDNEIDSNSNSDNGSFEDSDESEDSDNDTDGSASALIGRRPKTEAEEVLEKELDTLLSEVTRPKAMTAFLAGGAAKSDVPGREREPSSETVALRVMLRRGGRAERTLEMPIPVPASAARQLREKEAADIAERAELKRMVLEANRRDEYQIPQRFVRRGFTGGGS